ncbi:hypothetical protein C8R43DRAFT_979123 [Mycena crocata]|nr:hypothetical protein C8R43DRAFT_979123 [Mycena crocata]
MDDEPAQPRRSRWVPVAALGAGTVLIAAPLVYLWRVGKPRNISLRSGAAAPPRRVNLLSTSVASNAPSRFTLPAPEDMTPPPKQQDSDWDDADWGVPQPPPDPNDNFNASLYTFKAFGASTLIVGSIAYFNVDNAEDFGVKMRLAIMDNMPLLALRMRNALGPPTFSESQPDRPWQWDEAQAQERLSAAFDKGGLAAWADAAAKEVQDEARAEIKKRERR